MNQKSLGTVVLLPLAAAGATVTGTGKDIGAGYGNVGRREFRVHCAGYLDTNTTSIVFAVQENTTSASSGFAAVGGGTTQANVTTTGSTDIFCSATKRCLRVSATPAGTTANSVQYAVAFLENRETTS